MHEKVVQCGIATLSHLEVLYMIKPTQLLSNYKIYQVCRAPQTYWSHILRPVRVLNLERGLGMGFGCTLTRTVTKAGATGALFVLESIRGRSSLNFDNFPMRGTNKIHV